MRCTSPYAVSATCASPADWGAHDRAGSGRGSVQAQAGAPATAVVLIPALVSCRLRTLRVNLRAFLVQDSVLLACILSSR